MQFRERKWAANASLRLCGAALTVAGVLVGLVAAASGIAHAESRFVWIANDGSEIRDGTAQARDSACTVDRRTALMWEIKTRDGGLRDARHTYTPYDGNAAAVGAHPGYRDSHSGACSRPSMPGGSCNTEAYVQAVNAARLCGHADWRLPTVAELVGTADAHVQQERTGDSVFGATAPGWYWTALDTASPAGYSRVVLLPPGARARFYDGSYLVRLVRDIEQPKR